MYLNKFNSLIRRHGTRVTLLYRLSNGKARERRVRAIINLHHKGALDRLPDLNTLQRVALGKGDTRLILFLPGDVLDGYDGKSNVYLEIRGNDYVMLATSPFILGEKIAYTWMMVAPSRELIDDYVELGGDDDEHGTEN